MPWYENPNRAEYIFLPCEMTLGPDAEPWKTRVFSLVIALRTCLHIYYIGLCYTDAASPKNSSTQIALDILGFLTLWGPITISIILLSMFQNWLDSKKDEREQEEGGPSWIIISGIIAIIAIWLGALMTVHEVHPILAQNYAQQITLPNLGLLVLLGWVILPYADLFGLPDVYSLMIPQEIMWFGLFDSILRLIFHIWYLGQSYTGESAETTNQIILDISGFGTLMWVMSWWEFFLLCFEGWFLDPNPVRNNRRQEGITDWIIWIKAIGFLTIAAVWFGALLTVHQATMETLPDLEYLIPIVFAIPWEYLAIELAKLIEWNGRTNLAFLLGESLRTVGLICFIVYCYTVPNLVSKQDLANQIALDISGLIMLTAALYLYLDLMERLEGWMTKAVLFWVVFSGIVLIFAIFLGAVVTVHYHSWGMVV